jgi:hypothetical protein
MGDQGLAETEILNEVTDAQFLEGKSPTHLEAGGVGQGPESCGS